MNATDPIVLAAAALVLVLLAGFGLFVIRRRFGARLAEIDEAKLRFQTTFDQAAFGVAHLDLDGKWLRINRRFCELSGYSHAELMKLSIDDITHPNDRDADGNAPTSWRSGDSDTIVAEKRFVRKDGEILWVNTTRSTICDVAGRPEFLMKVIEEIGARKEADARLASSEARYRAIFDSAVEAMAIIDARGLIQSVNPSVERTFGYRPDELVGSNIKLLMPRTISQHHDAYLETYRRTGAKAIIGTGREVIGRRKDGSQFPLDLSVAEWERGGAVFFTGIMRDISARKQAETALRQSEDSLRSLQNEFAHLARVNDLGEMAAAIAHEINQPLTAIVNYLNTGLYVTGADKGAADPEELTQLMRNAFDQALRAGDIVRRLREFIGHGTSERRPEAIERLIDSALALALIDAHSTGISVDRNLDGGDALVEADAVQIQQVIANLARNATDAMLSTPRPGVTPTLTVSVAPCAGDMVEISIADNGPGISSEIAEHLFDPFITTKSNGMGMGLSVCRRLIEAHGGTIQVESMAGEGATFSFRLPLYRPVLH